MERYCRVTVLVMKLTPVASEDCLDEAQCALGRAPKIESEHLWATLFPLPAKRVRGDGNVPRPDRRHAVPWDCDTAGKTRFADDEQASELLPWEERIEVFFWVDFEGAYRDILESID